MPIINCSSSDCKYNNDKYTCTYKGVLTLSEVYCHTLNGGFEHFHKCKRYEQSEEAKKTEEDIKNFMKRKGFA